MTIDIVRDALLWSFIINMGFMFLWFFFFMLARSWAYKIHGKLFRISEERFNTINYTLMGFYKIFVFFFNLVPYIALNIIA